MTNLKTLLRDVEKMPRDAIEHAFFAESSIVLDGISKDGAENPVAVYLSIVFSMIAADGKLNESEYDLIAPMLEKVVDHRVSYADAKQFVFGGQSYDSKDTRANVVNMVNAIYPRNEDLATHIIMLLIYTSAIDGDICRRERAFISDLIR